MNTEKAVEIFRRTPKTHNCAQAVAEWAGRQELVSELAPMGGGRAPDNMCGALYAALAITPAERHADIRREFTAGASSERCREIKCNGVSCDACVALAAALLNNK